MTVANRRAGIGAVIAQGLALDGWDIATTSYAATTHRCRGGRCLGSHGARRGASRAGAKTLAIESDLASKDAASVRL